MNPQDPTTDLSAAELNRLHDQARGQALALRDEAIAGFWRGVLSAMWAPLSSARRAATWLSRRLQQHQSLGGAAPR